MRYNEIIIQMNTKKITLTKTNILSHILFYWYNSLFTKEAQQKFNLIVFLILAFVTFLWGFVNLLINLFTQNYIDVIHAFYSFAGIVGCISILCYAFYPAYNAHKSLIANTHYKSIHDYYVQRGF